MKIFFLFLLMVLPIALSAQVKFTPPATKAMPVIDTMHGVMITDDYRWLEDKTDTKVVEWTKAQHDYGIQYLNATQKVHPGLREGIASFIDLDYEGPLDKEAKRIFQTIRKKGD